MVAACIAPFDWSEIVMSRLLYGDLEPEDVLLASRGDDKARKLAESGS